MFGVALLLCESLRRLSSLPVLLSRARCCASLAEQRFWCGRCFRGLREFRLLRLRSLLCGDWREDCHAAATTTSATGHAENGHEHGGRKCFGRTHDSHSFSKSPQASSPTRTKDGRTAQSDACICCRTGFTSTIRSHANILLPQVRHPLQIGTRNAFAGNDKTYRMAGVRSLRSDFLTPYNLVGGFFAT